jgi:hypothetical protein
VVAAVVSLPQVLNMHGRRGAVPTGAVYKECRHDRAVESGKLASVLLNEASKASDI